MSTSPRVLFSIFLIVIRISHCQWMNSSSRLPLRMSAMAIGSYNNSVHVLGGTGDSDVLLDSLIVYDTVSDDYQLQSLFLPPNTDYLFGYSSYYTQIQTVLYIIVDNGTNILSYNMHTGALNSNYAALPYTVAWNFEISSCLASNTNHLFVAGGYTNVSLNTVQAYDILKDEWLSNVSTMQQQRSRHTCIVDPITDMLYAIGGDGISSIELIPTINITQNAWSYISGSLSHNNGEIRSVYFNNIIYVIGGAESAWGPYFDTVDLIHTIHGTVTQFDHSLLYSVASTGSIIVNERLYVFAGYTGVREVNTWMYYDLDTAPSTSTTAHPTHLPSTAPSIPINTTNTPSITSISNISMTSTLSLSTVQQTTSANTTPYTIWTTSDRRTSLLSTNNIIDTPMNEQKDILATIMRILLFVLLCMICSCCGLTVLYKLKQSQVSHVDIDMANRDIAGSAAEDDDDKLSAGVYSLEKHNNQQSVVTAGADDEGLNINGEPEVHGVMAPGINSRESIGDALYGPGDGDFMNLITANTPGNVGILIEALKPTNEGEEEADNEFEAEGDQALSEENDKLKAWFINSVHLPWCYPLFVEHGFEDLSTISLITMDDLEEMGIDENEHKLRLMQCIKSLHKNTDP